MRVLPETDVPTSQPTGAEADIEPRAVPLGGAVFVFVGADLFAVREERGD